MTTTFTKRIATLGAALGMASAMALTAASSAHAASGIGYLEKGSTGPGVACAQFAENWFLDPQPPKSPIAVDGDFGQNTYNETVWFQQQEGLSQDGVIGPATGNMIMGTINGVLQYDGNRTIWGGYTLADCNRYVPTS